MILIRYVGLGVHTDSIKIAVAEEGSEQIDLAHQYLERIVSLPAEPGNSGL